MYVRPGCPDVAFAREYLGEKGVDWKEIDIEQDPQAKQQVIDWNGGRAATPTLWIGDTMLVEPDADEIDEALSTAAIA
jgi:glutaredoxin